MGLFNRKEKRSVDLFNSYRTVFNTPEGKTVLYDLIKNNFVLAGVSSLEEEGRRQVVLSIMKTISTNPEKFLDHIKQMREEQENFDELD